MAEIRTLCLKYVPDGSPKFHDFEAIDYNLLVLIRKYTSI